jgi:hypothetical protein
MFSSISSYGNLDEGLQFVIKMSNNKLFCNINSHKCIIKVNGGISNHFICLGDIEIVSDI